MLPPATVRMPRGVYVLARNRAELRSLVARGGEALGIEGAIMLTPTADLNGAELAFLE